MTQIRSVIVLCAAGRHDHPAVWSAAQREIQVQAATDKEKVDWESVGANLITEGDITSQGSIATVGGAMHAVKYIYQTEPYNDVAKQKVADNMEHDTSTNPDSRQSPLPGL